MRLTATAGNDCTAGPCPEVLGAGAASVSTPATAWITLLARRPAGRQEARWQPPTLPLQPATGRAAAAMQRAVDAPDIASEEMGVRGASAAGTKATGPKRSPAGGERAEQQPEDRRVQTTRQSARVRVSHGLGAQGAAASIASASVSPTACRGRVIALQGNVSCRHARQDPRRQEPCCWRGAAASAGGAAASSRNPNFQSARACCAVRTSCA